MKGKLNKQGDRWVLYNEDSSKIALSTESPFYKLSLKNCESIANGYDLMMLAEEDSNKYYDVKTTDWHCNYNGFFGGFQKALEIIGDKKFSEEDIRKALSAGLSIGYGRQFEIENKQIEIDNYIQSLQKNEWDVEIVYDKDCYSSAGRCDKLTMVDCIICTPVTYLKDVDGCLILRRI